jgi:diaminobutyrate-2-oxoglutarate transaminase
VFERAQGYHLYDEAGRKYLDFFGGAGALNYGHNNPWLKRKVIEYIEKDGVTHALDMATTAKRAFLDAFQNIILQPRNLAYKVQFPGPTGTNSVEAAMKLARKVTGRSKIISFTNAFHGMTLGSLAVTGNAMKRNGAGVELTLGVTMPFEGYFEDQTDSIENMERLIADNGSGVDLPAAVIVETVQAEGGINAASFPWLQRLADLCKRMDMLLIVDDIQVGCGRTGPFFSFEPAGIQPDIVCLSKSIGGFGLPMALTLIKPELDQWEPGEHNGTFRGNNLAFIAATEALNVYWRTEAFSAAIREKAKRIEEFLNGIAERYPQLQPKVKGRGMIQGIELGVEGLASKVCREAFQRGLIMETAGPTSSVFKILPPLIIDAEGLEAGFKIITESIEAVAQDPLAVAV